ncbi:transmembrane protein 234 homolog [Vespa mandarinia]|uniref:transmembrane protein 234 homolog n=1 Tax=Vespa mandarinia TaxID=7446 RepID=UPI001610C00D|nr:transmembrane protein 234 homolog [Vespa mandarinia]XP_046838175.1 transmembrane protein 234 homolog [Vespa crabro]XP_047368524.1 transmembrane protein 234 homolog [Vespa velutina]
MTVNTESVIYLVLVAFLWGITNPLIKKGASGLENVEAKTSYGQFFKELYFLFTNAKYMTPFLFNQIGSLLYYLALQGADISLAVPVSNSLTFVITAVTGWILGEKRAERNTYIGMILILMGTTLCCWDKLYTLE